MILTILEAPLILVQFIFELIAKMLNKLIYKMNKIRRDKLDNYAKKNPSIMEDYDEKENIYVFLERNLFKTNGLLIVLAILIVISIFLYYRYGIEVMPM